MNGFQKISYWKNVFFTVVAAIMIAHGGRMIYQGIFKPNSYYPAPTPLTLDFWLDWTILLIIGIVVFVLSINAFYHKFNEKNKEKEKNLFFNPS